MHFWAQNFTAASGRKWIDALLSEWRVFHTSIILGIIQKRNVGEMVDRRSTVGIPPAPLTSETQLHRFTLCCACATQRPAPPDARTRLDASHRRVHRGRPCLIYGRASFVLRCIEVQRLRPQMMSNVSRAEINPWPGLSRRARVRDDSVTASPADASSTILWNESLVLSQARQSRLHSRFSCNGTAAAFAQSRQSRQSRVQAAVQQPWIRGSIHSSLVSGNQMEGGISDEALSCVA